MQLALFDLDNTLIPMDSDHQWGEFMVRIGAVNADRHRAQNDQFYRDYQAGRLDNEAYLAFQLAPLARYSRAQLDEWHAQFMREVILPVVTPQAEALVAQHRDRGDLCLMVTATNAFVTAPIARRFGLEHLIATDLATVGDDPAAPYTGAYKGVPSYREGKVIRTLAWLEQRGQQLKDFERSWFYSDSANDIPLLEKVSDPVAVNADARLQALARERGWRCLDLFGKAS